MSATTWTELRTGITTVLEGITDVGLVVVRQRLPNDWVEFLKAFKTEIDDVSMVRAWIVLPGRPFRLSEVDASGGHYRDTYNFTLVGIQSAKDEDDSWAGALQRAHEVSEALDAKQGYGLSTSGESIFFAGPCSIQAHEYRKYGNIGVWYTELDFGVQVNRTLTYG